MKERINEILYKLDMTLDEVESHCKELLEIDIPTLRRDYQDIKDELDRSDP